MAYGPRLDSKNFENWNQYEHYIRMRHIQDSQVIISPDDLGDILLVARNMSTQLETATTINANRGNAVWREINAVDQEARNQRCCGIAALIGSLASCIICCLGCLGK